MLLDRQVQLFSLRGKCPFWGSAMLMLMPGTQSGGAAGLHTHLLW